MPNSDSVKTSLPPSLRLQQGLGAIGALLAFVILAASILLRLTSVIEEAGVRSTLPVDVENAVRLVHRLSAAGVGLLALVVTSIAWMRRQQAPHAVQAVVWIVAATLLLAAVGPLTPGYRFNSVTVANVVAGTILLGACWWLRESLAWGMASPGTAHHPLLRMTFTVFVVHVGLGAAASALEMRGTHWVAFVHSGSAMLTAMLLGSILWDYRTHARLAPIVVGLGALLGSQLVLGVASLLVQGRPVALGFVHAMLSPLLAGGLVSIAVRERAVVFKPAER